MTLAEQLEAAKQRDKIARWDAAESRLAAQLELNVPRPALAADVLERFNLFGKWAEGRFVRKLPAKPKSIAAFVLEQRELGAALQVIVALLEAIIALHDYHGLSNPVATKVVDCALERIGGIKPPRWDSYSRSEWAKLPPLVRDAITKREGQRDKVLNKRLSDGAGKTVHNTETEKVDEHETQG